jgi:hypothetical protein
VIEDHQTSRSHQLAEVKQVDKYVVKDVTSVDERCVGDKPSLRSRGRVTCDRSSTIEPTLREVRLLTCGFVVVPTA